MFVRMRQTWSIGALISTSDRTQFGVRVTWESYTAACFGASPSSEPVDHEDGGVRLAHLAKAMNPDEMLRVPFHATVHAYDQRPVTFEVREAFGSGFLVCHVTQTIVCQ